MQALLVVDDRKRAHAQLAHALTAAGFEVAKAADGEEGWERFADATPAVVVTDLAMPRCDGIELLRRIRSRSDLPVILFSANGSIRRAADAFKAGADDFIDLRDVDVDELVARVRQAARSPRKDSGSGAIEERILGDSPAIERIRWQLAGLAPLSTPVLVTGERGTGRSLAVATLHELGSTSPGQLRRFESARFVPADFCDPGTIGAVQLIDVEQLTPDAQRYWAHRLARDEKSKLAPNLRLFATSSGSLAERAQAGSFDRSLARALLRFHVEMPALRDRRQDVPAIAEALLRRIGRRMGRPRVRFSSAALGYLAECRLPENGVQLERLLERAVAYTLGGVVHAATLEDLMSDLERSIECMRDEHRLHERERLLRALQETGGNITHTAGLLDKSRAAVYRLIAKHDIPLARRGPQRERDALRRSGEGRSP
jgi:DNA-binding NtrC family response regulator